MKPAIRLAAIMKVPTIYICTHDSIGLGEDGPTHQPIGHLAMLRALPGLRLFRPADATETVEAWRYVISHPDKPSCWCSPGRRWRRSTARSSARLTASAAGRTSSPIPKAAPRRS